MNAFWIGPTESFVSANKVTSMNFLTRWNIQSGEQLDILPESWFGLHGSPYDKTCNDRDDGTEQSNKRKMYQRQTSSSLFPARQRKVFALGAQKRIFISRTEALSRHDAAA